MSLEQIIFDLTQAIERNSDIMERIEKRGLASSVTQVGMAGVSEAPSILATGHEPTALPPVTYEDVKRVTIEVSKKDKSRAVDALARFSVTTAKALKEEQWNAYVEYMQDVLNSELS